MKNFSAISMSSDRRYCGEPLSAIHVLAGLDIVHGGPTYSVPRLCEALARHGVDTTQLSVAGTNDVFCRTDVPNFHPRRYPHDCAGTPILRSLRKSSGLARELRQLVPATDVIHNHGLWLMPNIYSGREAARAGKPLVVSPRGMLSKAALSFSQWKKRLFWLLQQGPAVRGAGCFHATGDGEYEDIRAFGLTNPVAIIPNGIDIPEYHPGENAGHGRKRVVLSLGRVHPKKGLDRLVRAWAGLESSHPDWHLKIVGPGERGHVEHLQVLATTLGVSHISFDQPIYGERKIEAYRNADVFVLPSLNENFGMTVAESLAAGTPVISTKGAPWSGLEQEGCGWWIDHGVDPLAASLKTAMAMPRESLHAMGKRGRSWMERDFSWNRISEEMITLYDWLAGHGSAPKSIRFD